jgi:predicted GNAT family acetyltransferase
VSFLTARTVDDQKTPFLHVKSENGAKALYEKLGFQVRRPICLTILTRG